MSSPGGVKLTRYEQGFRDGFEAAMHLLRDWPKDGELGPYFGRAHYYADALSVALKLKTVTPPVRG